MHTQIEQTSATGQRAVATPGLVRPIGVVEAKIDGHDLAQLTAADALAQLAHSRDMPIAEVDAEQPIRSARSREHALYIESVSREGLLAEHRQPALETGNGLIRMQAVGRCDDDAIEIGLEQAVQLVEARRLRIRLSCILQPVRIGIEDGGNLCIRCSRDGIQAFATDPADADEAEFRRRRIAHGRRTHALASLIIMALTNPSGRRLVSWNP